MRTRLPLLTAGAMIGMLTLPPPAQASEGPWCTSQPVGPGSVIEDCQYKSIERCRSEVIAGNRGVCVQNPRWPGWWQQHSGKRGARMLTGSPGHAPQ